MAATCELLLYRLNYQRLTMQHGYKIRFLPSSFALRVLRGVHYSIFSSFQSPRSFEQAAATAFIGNYP